MRKQKVSKTPYKTPKKRFSQKLPLSAPPKSSNFELDEIQNIEKLEEILGAMEPIEETIAKTRKKKSIIKKPSKRSKRKRYTPAKNAYEDKIKLSIGNEYIIPRATFQRVVRDIASKMSGSISRIQISALEILQDAAEYYLIEMFNVSNVFAVLEKRQTIQVKHLRMAHLVQNNLNIHSSRRDMGELFKHLGKINILQ